MHSDAPTPWLGGLSPAQFMRRHWQKKPLLVRQAWPDAAAPIERRGLFALAARDDVESRLVRREGRGWALRHGPLPRRALPPLKRPGWTLLVQGLDLHLPAARALLDRFAFIPHARLDDLMLSWASDRGGVGPHVDSYDVFLLQVAGRRRWRIGRCRDPRLRPSLPLKILARFEPEQEWVLEPGDLLYLPPMWAHDGEAVGECMTASIGFRSPARDEIARALMARCLDDEEADPPAGPSRLYADPSQPATEHPGRVPAALADFAAEALRQALGDGERIGQWLGEWLSEPKPGVWFDAGTAPAPGAGLRLDARSRMLYDDRCLYLNGESWRMGGRDAQVLRRLADRRRIEARELARLSAPARTTVAEWIDAGWLHGDRDDDR